MAEVLLIDDDTHLCQMLVDYLGRYGFMVSTAHRGDTGLQAAHEKPWALILLDVMLPGLDGFEVLRRIRAVSTTNVLLLTAQGEDVDRIIGLEIGADDYLPKPFNPRELLARMRAIIRRSTLVPTNNNVSASLCIEDLQLDPAARTVLQNGERLELTDVEFALLETLMRSSGKVVAREELAESALGRKFNPFDRSLDMHVSRLRRKLGGDGVSDERVKTVRGAGYQFVLHRD